MARVRIAVWFYAAASPGQKPAVLAWTEADVQGSRLRGATVSHAQL
jgi:hypothetical protein